MSNPTKYEPSYSFSGFQEANPSRPLPAQRVDVEFQNVARTAGELIAALGDVRRSDGQLANGIVTLEALSTDVQGRLGGGGKGSVEIDDIDGLRAELDGLDTNVRGVDDELDRLNVSRGQANGIATLGPDSRVPVVNLPTASANAAGIVRVTDNLTSTAGGAALSANQGRVLATEKADKATTIAGYEIRDAYTKTEVNQLIADVEAAAGDGSGETGASLLSKLLTVDGAGSGLDADMLDGRTAADFVLAETMPGQLAAPVRYGKIDPMADARLFGREGAAADARAYRLTEAASPFNPNYEGGNYIAQHVRHVAEGTNKNGPRGAALGLGVSMFKEGFGTGTAKGGEVDAVYIVVRQDSPRDNSQGINDPNRGDACGILIDAAVHEKVGFVGLIEGATTVLANDGSGPKRRLVAQVACTDTTTEASTGYFTAASLGEHGAGLHVHMAEADGGFFRSPIYVGTEKGQIFGVDRDGSVALGRRLNNGDLVPRAMHLVVQGDSSLGIVNADKTVQLVNVTQNGDVNAYGQVNARTNMSAGVSVTSPKVRILSTNEAGVSANWLRGTLFVDGSGRLLYCDTDGTAPKVVSLGGAGSVVEERGAWSPQLQGVNGSPVSGYSATGTWFKSGSLVFVEMSWSISRAGSASGPTLQVANMPFARTMPTCNIVGRSTATANAGKILAGNGGTGNPRLLNLAIYDTDSLVVSNGSGYASGTFVA